MHEVKIHTNNIRFILAKKGDTFYSISREFDMGLWQIFKYNELQKGDILKAYGREARHGGFNQR